MNTHATFEQRLEQALELDPEASTLQALDERIARAIARVPDARAASRWSLRRASRPVLALVLLVILAGGAVAGSGFLSRVAESVPAFASAWERATPIGQSETVDGRTVTVVRAYADANLILVGMSLRDRSGEAAELGGFEVRVDGVGEAQGMGGPGHSSSFESARVLTFVTPLGVGDVVPITLVTRDPPATFRFEVPNSGGTTVEPDLRGDAAGVTATLERLTIAPTGVSGRVALAGEAIEMGDSWHPLGGIRSGGFDARMAMSQSYTADHPFVEFRTVEGSDVPSGTWTVTIDEIIGNEDGEQIRLAGPWVFEVPIP